MAKTVLHSDAAPKAIGPYSQAIRVGQLVFTSGQIGLDPATGDLVSGGIDSEVRRAFANLAAVAGAAGLTLADAVKLTLYLTDLSEFAKVNALMSELVPAPHPARTTVGVASLPRGARFEVEAILAA